MEGMTSGDFKAAVSDMANIMVDYQDNIRDRRVVPDVKPGYLRPLIPDHAPEEPEKWEDVKNDIERVIMPGVSHWQSPQFHAFYPAGQSYPSVLADMLSDTIACIGFTWMASPACTELEVVMMDWLGELLDLPKEFLFKTGAGGGGVIQGTASEATLVALLCAKAKIFKEESITTIAEKSKLTAKLVAYTSEEAHSSVERAFLLAGVDMRLVPTDDNCSLRGDQLKKAMDQDIAKGLRPFYVCATLGTTSSCAFDNLVEIGQITSQNNIWLHVDAAYAGSAFICEEFRYLMDGVQLADSFNFNPHKWLLVNFDCSTMWVKSCRDIADAFQVDPVYLKHKEQGNIMPDYRHWHIPLGRRFRSLKLWFVMRLYGASGLRNHIRNHVALAKQFEGLVCKDNRFEVVFPSTLGLVCFKFKESQKLNEKLVRFINESGVIFLSPSTSKGIYYLRFAVCSAHTNADDISLAWKEIQKQTDNVINDQ